MSEKTLNDELAKEMLHALDQLIASVEQYGMTTGTAISNGVAKIGVDGKWYEIQLRLEENEKSWIGPDDIVSSAQLGDTMSLA